jgi:hypothetical protein
VNALNGDTLACSAQAKAFLPLDMLDLALI